MVSWQDLWTRSLYARDLLPRSLYEISVQALYKSSLGKIYARDLLARSLQQISMQCLCTRSPKEDKRGVLAISLCETLCKISVQDLCHGSLGKTLEGISAQTLYLRTFWQNLYKRSLVKIFATRSLYELSVQDLWPSSV